MYSLDDTIAAISTPIGQGGIGIVRLSGPEALDIALCLFSPISSFDPANVEPYRLHYGHVVDPDSEDAVDEVLLSYMRAPHSYTCQDVVEFNGHGGPVPLQRILGLCLDQGARMAREGEFTLRAFLNGRLDLSQAEAVLDVISAKTDAALGQAVEQLRGRLSQQVVDVREQLLEILAYLEARIDFPEDDVPEQDIGPVLSEAKDDLEALLQEAAKGAIYREGVRTAIVGRPNVGKSSLLNTLLRTDRAIVTPVPGTTRDTLEETVSIDGVPFVLTDTAGIIETDDLVEQLGIQRARDSLARADLVLLVVDSSVAPSPEDERIADLVSQERSLVIVNKADLATRSDYAHLLPETRHVTVSALTGEGLEDLESILVKKVLHNGVSASANGGATSSRHRHLFRRALAHVEDAQKALAVGRPADLISIDVSEAIYALGKITGETASEELLEAIFSKFCIGK